jgi:hypothetical protein
MTANICLSFTRAKSGYGAEYDNAMKKQQRSSHRPTRKKFFPVQTCHATLFLQAVSHLDCALRLLALVALGAIKEANQRPPWRNGLAD